MGTALLIVMSLSACTAPPPQDAEQATSVSPRQEISPPAIASSAQPAPLPSGAELTTEAAPPAISSSAQPAPLPSGAELTTEAAPPQPATPDLVWSAFPGEANGVGIGGEGEDQAIWALGNEEALTGYDIKFWGGSNWDSVDNAAVALDVGPDGYPWIIDNENQIFRWTGEGWSRQPGAARDIGIGADGSVWIIGTNPVPGGYDIYRWAESTWEQVPGGAVAIDAVTLDEPWIVTDDHRILQWTENQWSQQPGEARDIATGANGTVWIIGNTPQTGGYTIGLWNGAGWTNVAGGGLKISVNADGLPYVVDDQQQLLRGGLR